MTLAAGTRDESLIRQVQKALGETSLAAQLVPMLYGDGLEGLQEIQATPPASVGMEVTWRGSPPARSIT